MTRTDPSRALTGRLLSAPDRWPCWPFLPLSRRRAGGALDLGVVYDALGHGGRTGYRATVFRINLFAVHAVATVEEFLAWDRETFDTTDELLDAGWRVD
jgi:hypothetical protein